MLSMRRQRQLRRAPVSLHPRPRPHRSRPVLPRPRCPDSMRRRYWRQQSCRYSYCRSHCCESSCECRVGISPLPSIANVYHQNCCCGFEYCCYHCQSAMASQYHRRAKRRRALSKPKSTAGWHDWYLRRHGRHWAKPLSKWAQRLMAARRRWHSTTKMTMRPRPPRKTRLQRPRVAEVRSHRQICCA